MPAGRGLRGMPTVHGIVRGGRAPLRALTSPPDKISGLLFFFGGCFLIFVPANFPAGELLRPNSPAGECWFSADFPL